MDQAWTTWVEKDNDLDIEILALDISPSNIQFEIDDITYTLERFGSGDKAFI